MNLPALVATLILSAAVVAPPPDSELALRVGDADGHTITLNDPGMLYLVDFIALGCKPCVQEVPELERLAKEYEPGGRFRLISVVASGWEGKDLLMVAHEIGTTLPIYSDPDDLFRLLDIRAFPTKLLLRDGKVLHRKRGGGLGAYDTWKKEIDAALQSPPVATSR